MREKAKGPGYLDLGHRLDEMVEQLVRDFLAGNPLHWPVASKQQVHRVWSDFVRDGYVRNERLLDSIYASIRDNVLRLEIGTIVCEHTATPPGYILDEHLDMSQYDAFCDWLVDFDGVGRLSDYGLVPLQDAIALAYEAKTPESRLKYLDRALNVTHMRGDLSRLFIEGGRTTVITLPVAEVQEDCFA